MQSVNNFSKIIALKIIHFLLKKMNGYISFYTSSYKNYEDEIESYFDRLDGTKLPIYKHYRYYVKKGWTYFDSLNILNNFIQTNKSQLGIKTYFHETIGNRTISKPITEIHQFIQKNNLSSTSILKKNDVKSLIKLYKQQHVLLFSKIKILTQIDLINSPKTILEIGFISGGHSVFAYEELGLEAYAIDNCYDGLVDQYDKPFHIQNMLDSNVNFSFQDITDKTTFKDEMFDIIYSSSVLEHIKDIEKAFQEMYRILKKGGVIIHNYNPFFSPNGGHALGIIDCPWGHLRMELQDYAKYLTNYRPFESEWAIPWIHNALNRYSIAQMQKSIIKQGYNILIWQESAAPKDQINLLNHEVLSDIYNYHENITLSDLISENIFFVAKK